MLRIAWTFGSFLIFVLLRRYQLYLLRKRDITEIGNLRLNDVFSITLDGLVVGLNNSH